jgi:MFS family permease
MDTSVWQLRDVRLLFATRIVRLVAYGGLAVILALYLAEVGLAEGQIGWLLSLTLAGDILISLWMTTSADRLGRRKMLIAGALLMIGAGVVFAITDNYLVLVMAAIVGVISPSGNEIGPFLSVEQASLSQVIPGERRTGVFAWYNLIGSIGTACGALVSGAGAQLLQSGAGLPPLVAYRTILIGYAFFGAVLVLLFLWLSPAVEVPPAQVHAGERRVLGLRESRPVVLRLSALFALDAFGGGFVVQALLAYWFVLSFGAEPAQLGAIFFAANLLAGVSALSAACLAARIGLINTMVFTHIPSNVLLMLVPLMPTMPLAVLVLLLRFSISQMDVPTRQSYTMAVVAPDERAAAAGVTNIARSVGAMLSPALAAALLANPLLMNVPFYLAGGIKITYDLLLYRRFRAVKPAD